MRITADVKCYMCGFVSGEVVGESGKPVRLEKFRPSEACVLPAPRPGDTLRCCKCGGPVYLDDVRPVVERVEVMEPPPKRGRPRKHPLPSPGSGSQSSSRVASPPRRLD